MKTLNFHRTFNFTAISRILLLQNFKIDDLNTQFSVAKYIKIIIFNSAMCVAPLPLSKMNKYT